MVIPCGEVTIMRGSDSMTEPPDWIRRRFPIGLLGFFQALQGSGLITLREKEQSQLESFGNAGERFFKVTPTPKLLQLQTEQKSSLSLPATEPHDILLALEVRNQGKSSLSPWTTNYVAVRMGTMRLIEVLKEDEYKMPNATAGDEFRLVLGTLRRTPTPQARELGANQGAT
jgi:hypothetical protein